MGSVLIWIVLGIWREGLQPETDAGIWCRCTELICLEILFELSRVSVYVSVYTCATGCVERSEDTLLEIGSPALLKEGGYLFGRLCRCTASPGPADP